MLRLFRIPTFWLKSRFLYWRVCCFLCLTSPAAAAATASQRHGGGGMHTPGTVAGGGEATPGRRRLARGRSIRSLPPRRTYSIRSTASSVFVGGGAVAGGPHAVGAAAGGKRASPPLRR